MSDVEESDDDAVELCEEVFSDLFEAADDDDDAEDVAATEDEKKKYRDEWRQYKRKINSGKGVTKDETGKRHRQDEDEIFCSYEYTSTTRQSAHVATFPPTKGPSCGKDSREHRLSMSN